MRRFLAITPYDGSVWVWIGRLDVRFSWPRKTNTLSGWRQWCFIMLWRRREFFKVLRTWSVEKPARVLFFWGFFERYTAAPYQRDYDGNDRWAHPLCYCLRVSGLEGEKR